jgi:uncharacterized repeat protein (TIGR03803 family)
MTVAKSVISRLCFVLLVVALGFAAKIASAQTEEPDAAASPKFVTLHSFSGSDGDTPQAGLVQATNGDLYGTTGLNGANGWGTIFKITPDSTLTTLHNFCSQPGCADGSHPAAALNQATNGDLYGTTWFGGIANPSCYLGSCGTIFKIIPSGAFATIYSFCAQAGCSDGANDSFGARPLVQAANGDLYGTTGAGGIANPSCGGTCGTIFKITPSGAFATIYRFCSQAECSDGYGPGPLVQVTNGDLYGTTLAGGLAYPSCGGTCGTIFKITPSGTLTTLYKFCSQPNCSDGIEPFGALVQAANGDLYGTTLLGGIANPSCIGSCGTIFKITPSGTLTTLYSFCSQPTGCTEGYYSASGLVRAASGHLYGVTHLGGARNSGAIFKITPSGTFTTLYVFCSSSNCADGQYPEGLAQATNGIFYGTAENGGAKSFGNVFAFSTGQAPFVETRPTAGKVGETVTILGYKLTGATSVTFNGTPVAFTVKAATEISTTVPAGATTGNVQVITPSGTLSSNKVFEVAP